jgi:formylglycine-generating enzyme required for sulfatase activity
MSDRPELLREKLKEILDLEAAYGISPAAAQPALETTLTNLKQAFYALLNEPFVSSAEAASGAKPEPAHDPDPAEAAPGVEAPVTTAAGPDLGDIQAGMVNVATNQSISNTIINTFYQNITGHGTTDDDQRRLEWYLKTIVNDQNNQVEIELQHVFLALATRRPTPLFLGLASQSSNYIEANYDPIVRPLLNRDPAWVLPDMAIVQPSMVQADKPIEVMIMGHAQRAEPQPNDPAMLLSRSLLVSEAIQEARRSATGMVLLGDPGSGKSLFLNYLARTTAQRWLGNAGRETKLVGWDDQTAPIPILLKIRQLAADLANQATIDPTDVIFDTLKRTLGQNTENMGDVLNETIHNGGLLLLFDGLDEIALSDQPGMSGRSKVADALNAFLKKYPGNLAIVTCRTRAFTDDLRNTLGWRDEILAPLTIGQIRALSYSLFWPKAEAGQRVHRRDLKMAAQRAEQFVQLIISSPQLLALAYTPELLQLMTSLTQAESQPSEQRLNRSQLYEHLVDQMLTSWELEQPVIKETDYTLTRDILDGMRQVLEELTYQAFVSSAGNRDQVRIAYEKLFTKLFGFFSVQEPNPKVNPAEACLKYMEQRGDLLLRDGESYSFAQSSLQEYSVACYMASDTKLAMESIMQYRQSDTWREPILLCVGKLGSGENTHSIEINRILEDLISDQENTNPKPIERWYQDLLLTADLVDLRGWDALSADPLFKAKALRKGLATGLVQILADPHINLTASDRARAGLALAQSGDPRYPSELADWQARIGARPLTFANTAESTSMNYLCYLPAGSYTEPAGAPLALPEYWITAYPVTVGQFARFVEQGYTYSSAAWWSRHGQQWRGHRSEPIFWEKLKHGPENTPMVGVTWYEASAYCSWLTTQCSADLPAGYCFRLPTTDEWRVAASTDGTTTPRVYPWGNEPPTDDHAIFGETQIGECAPIGSRPRGRAACGAFDMAGNVWEWTYAPSEPTSQAPTPAICGGAWNSDSTDLRCDKFESVMPDRLDILIGFRMVLAPAIAK